MNGKVAIAPATFPSSKLSGLRAGTVNPAERPLTINLEQVGDQPPQDPTQHESGGGSDRPQQR